MGDIIGILQGPHVTGHVGTETSQGHGGPAERRGNVGTTGPHRSKGHYWSWGMWAGKGSGNEGHRELTTECLCYTEREGLAGGRFWVNHGTGQGQGFPLEGQEELWADSAGKYHRPSGAATCPGAYQSVPGQ